MSKLNASLLDRYARTDAGLRQRMDELRQNPESGLEQATWTAIITVGGAVLAVTILGLITAWATGYIGKLPG
jgi:hypothetical protein